MTIFFQWQNAVLRKVFLKQISSNIMLELNEELAELAGTIIGDGCLSKYWARYDNCWRFEIAYTGHAHDREHYTNFIRPTFIKYFGIKGSLTNRKTCNAVQFHMKSKRPFDYFNALGLPIGHKQFDLKIPLKILENNVFALSCVKGIWDTDGSIYRRYSKIYRSQKKHYPNYAIMELKMKANVVNDVKKILEANNISCNRIVQNDGEYVLRITNQKMIQKYVQSIGFRNKYHLNRFNLITNNR